MVHSYLIPFYRGAEDWERVRTAPPAELARVIQMGGLAQ